MDLFPDYDEVSFIVKFVAVLLYVVCMLGISTVIRKYSAMNLLETIVIVLAWGIGLGLFFMIAIISIPFDFMLK